MIKFENTRVVGWDSAIRGMRNPKNSWGKMDSDWSYCCDEGLPVHAKYRRMIVVYVDITAPLYWWKEFDTYKVGTVANSCSTMHKIAAKEFTLDDFSQEHLSRTNNYEMGGYIMDATIEALNYWRGEYLKLDKSIKDIKLNGNESIIHMKERQKDYWRQMIQLLPSSYNQKRTVMLNYEVLAGIYPMRKNHKLDEWSEHTYLSKIKAVTMEELAAIRGRKGFCDWIKTLPYSELITGDTKETVELFTDGKKVATLENGLTPDDLLKKYTPNQVREAFGYPPVQDFSSCMHPPIEEEIYIEDILTRADVAWSSDMINGFRVVKSRNTKEPLTEQEQECLKRMWRNQGFRGDFIFYVEEPNADNGKM